MTMNQMKKLHFILMPFDINNNNKWKKVSESIEKKE